MVDTVNTGAEAGAGTQTPGAPSEAEMEQQVAEAKAADAGHEPPKTKAEQASGDRPSWLPEKFKTPEDMVKAYGELESKLGSEGTAPSETTGATQEATAGDAQASADTAQAAVEGAGFDFAALTKEYTESGQLSQETYDALAKGGFPKEAVDSYIAGQKALADQFTNEVFDIAGGEETYQRMVEWSAEGMTDQERAAYNEALDSKDPERVKLAVRGAFEKFKGDGGVEPDLVNGGNGPSEGPGFFSREDYYAALEDPRYATSPEYQAQVDAKLARSHFIRR